MAVAVVVVFDPGRRTVRGDRRNAQRSNSVVSICSDGEAGQFLHQIEVPAEDIRLQFVSFHGVFSVLRDACVRLLSSVSAGASALSPDA